MNSPDYQGARRYAVHRLQDDLAAIMTYHSIVHTLDEVVPAAERLAGLEGLNGIDVLLVRTAALFHDLGYIESSTNHELVSIEIARRVLPDYGYDTTQVDAVASMILATRLPQSPKNLLEQVLADADLDILGRENFLARNQDLRNELKALGRTYSDADWYRNQRDFLFNHHYHTSSARSLRDAQKKKNLSVLDRLLRASMNSFDRPGFTGSA